MVGNYCHGCYFCGCGGGLVDSGGSLVVSGGSVCADLENTNSMNSAEFNF